MGVLCLLLDKKKQYFPLLVDIFNVTGHKLLIGLDEEKALDFLKVSSPEVLLLPLEDINFWFEVLKNGNYILPIFFVEDYEKVEEFKIYGFKDVNFAVLPFNPMELLTKVVALSKKTHNQEVLEYLGPLNLAIKFMRSGSTLILNIEGEGYACSLFFLQGIIKGSTCQEDKIAELMAKHTKIRLEPFKEDKLIYTFEGNWDFLSKLVYNRIYRPTAVERSLEKEGEESVVIKPKVDLSQAVKLRDGLYWVGVEDEKGLFQKNSYLRIYEKGDIRIPILINIGTPQDYVLIRSKVEQVVGTVDVIKAVILMGAGVDIASGLFNFLQSNQKAFVITTLNIAQRLRSFGIPQSRIKAVESLASMRLKLATGDVLKFISMPFLPEVGSFVVLEESTGYLFTGQFLSSYCSIDEFNPLENANIDDVLSYTLPNIPSKDILMPALKRLLAMNFTCVYPMFGNPITSLDSLNQIFERLINTVGSSHKLDERMILEVCEDILRLLKENAEKGEISALLEELNQFIYMEDAKILQTFVEVESLPHLLLSLAFTKGIDVHLIKKIISKLQRIGLTLTI